MRGGGESGRARRRSDLRGRQIAVWGLGAEGRSALGYLRRRLPDVPLTVLDESPEPAAATREWLRELGGVRVVAGAGAAAALFEFDLVVRSPGVSLYRPEIEAARRRGVGFTSATQLFFDERHAGSIVAVTGTKGKSTTVALLVHCLRAAGVEAEAAGNIGRPALELLELSPAPRVAVLEVSSYQAADLDVRPDAAVLLNLYPEHLPWHGTLERYYRDKLRLFRRLGAGEAILDREDATIRAFRDRFQSPLFFNDESGFHLREGWIREGRRRWIETAALPLPGRHNAVNACAALAAARWLGASVERCVAAVASFEGLPHRLRRLGERDGVLWVDDSISTIPESAAAAVAAFGDRPLTLLLGGHERGLDYGGLARALVERPVHAVVTMPESGPRIAAAVRAAAEQADRPGRPRVREASDLEHAVRLARELTPHGGAVLLSPGAASFGRFADYRERARAFARAAGFESVGG